MSIKILLIHLNQTVVSIFSRKKPKTDYTYAMSGLYIQDKVHDQSKITIPNLCRPPMKVPNLKQNRHVDIYFISYWTNN